MSSFKKSWHIILIFLIAACLPIIWVWREYAVLGYLGFPLDDSWIHAQFARNLVAGYGFSYNPGEPMSGSTSILWTLLVAFGYLFYMNPIYPTLVIAIILHFAAGWMTYLLAQLISGNKWVGVAAGITCVLTPRLVAGAVMGLEVPLYVFLTAASLYLYLKFRLYDDHRQYYATAVMALAALSRPELLCLFPLAVFDRLLTSAIWQKEQRGFVTYLRQLPIHLLIYAVILSPAVIFNIKAAGSPFPNTFAAKVFTNVFTYIKGGKLGLAAILLFEGVAQFVTDAFSLCVRDAWPVAIALLPGIYFVTRQAITGTGPTRSFILPLVLIGIPAATALFSPLGIAYHQISLHWGRYSAYLVPPFLAMGFYGIYLLCYLRDPNNETKTSLNDRRFSTCFLVIFCVFLGGTLYKGQATELRMYVRSVRCINDMQVTLGEWVFHNVPEDAVVATNDIGAIAYFGHRKILDVEGLVNPEILSYRRNSFAKYGNVEKGVLDYLKMTKPDYLIIFPSWYPRISQLQPLLEPIKEVTLTDNVIAGGNTMVIYKTHWDKYPDIDLDLK